MKTQLLLIILSFFSVLSCSKNCSLNYEIVGTEFKIPYFDYQNKAFREVEKVDYDRYELVNVNECEIPYIMEILNSQIRDLPMATNNMIEELCEYSVQISAVYDRKQKSKKIYLNFECGFVDYKAINLAEEYLIDSNNNLMRFYETKDGGDCYFQAVINTATNKLWIVFINGEA